MWSVCELGIVTSKVKYEMHMGKPIELYRVNISFKIKVSRGYRHYNVHRDEKEKTANTRYFVLDREDPSPLFNLPDEYHYNLASASKAGPYVWFRRELWNKKASAYYMPYHYKCGRIMARPSEAMAARLKELGGDDLIDENVTNFIDKELHVMFVYYEARNVTELHPFTGNAPFWHPLSAKSEASVGDIRKEQVALSRK